MAGLIAGILAAHQLEADNQAVEATGEQQAQGQSVEDDNPEHHLDRFS